MSSFFRSMVLRTSLTAAIILHLSYVTRVGYVGLNLAPDCPVIGTMSSAGRHTSSEACCESVSEPVAYTATLRGESSQSSDEQKPSKKNSEDCGTCQKFSLSNKLVSYQADASVVDKVPAPQAESDPSSFVPIYFPLDSEARGPPVYSV